MKLRVLRELRGEDLGRPFCPFGQAAHLAARTMPRLRSGVTLRVDTPIGEQLCDDWKERLS